MFARCLTCPLASRGAPRERRATAAAGDAQAGRRSPVGLIVTVSFFVSAGLMIGQSGIEALFFDRYGVDKLPVMYLVLGAHDVPRDDRLRRAARAARARAGVPS